MKVKIEAIIKEDEALRVLKAPEFTSIHLTRNEQKGDFEFVGVYALALGDVQGSNLALKQIDSCTKKG